MNTIPHADVIKVTGCNYCGVPDGVLCRTASGNATEYPHKVRTERGRSIIRQTAAEARLADPRVEVRVAALEAGLKAALLAITTLGEVIADVADDVGHLGALEDQYRKLLVKQSVQLVLDGLDSDEPAFEDVWEVDEWRMGESLRLRVEEVVL